MTVRERLRDWLGIPQSVRALQDQINQLQRKQATIWSVLNRRDRTAVLRALNNPKSPFYGGRGGEVCEGAIAGLGKVSKFQFKTPVEEQE